MDVDSGGGVKADASGGNAISTDDGSDPTAKGSEKTTVEGSEVIDANARVVSQLQNQPTETIGEYVTEKAYKEAAKAVAAQPKDWRDGDGAPKPHFFAEG